MRYLKKKKKDWSCWKWWWKKQNQHNLILIKLGKKISTIIWYFWRATTIIRCKNKSSERYEENNLFQIEYRNKMNRISECARNLRPEFTLFLFFFDSLSTIVSISAKNWGNLGIFFLLKKFPPYGSYCRRILFNNFSLFSFPKFCWWINIDFSIKNFQNLQFFFF